MAKWGDVDYEQLKQLQGKLSRFSETEKERFCSDVIKEIAARLLRTVKKRTPVGQYEIITYQTKEGSPITYNQGKHGGELRRRWSIKKDVTKKGNVYQIEIYNPLEYASYVEYGHRQQAGRFVPQIGKRLTSGWVNGRYMLTISEAEIRNNAPQIIEKRLTQKLKEIF